ncbi:MAG: phage tail protein [Deltaproteobacteria bacterium]|nr:phage tail protein [Deltaproteobacteria bacterium]MCP5007178.1 phage tail protein [Planctomycetota bacterium]
MPKTDPFRQFRFRVEIDGITQAGFSECSFADTTTDPVEYREGDEPPVQRKLSALTKYGNITLKWGITDSMDIYDWRQKVVDTGALDARKNVSIILIDEAGADQSRWDIERAWPTKYDPPDFSAKGNDVAIETLEIVHEGFKRVQ